MISGSSIVLLVGTGRTLATVTSSSAATIRRATASGAATVTADGVITTSGAAIIRHATASGAAERQIDTAGTATIAHATASGSATVSAGASTPTFIGFATSSTGAPTFPAHQVGDLCIGLFQRGANTAATPDAAEGWTQWGSAYSGSSSSAVLAWKIADTTSEVWGDWVQAGRRHLWIFRDAAIGIHNGVVGAAATSFTWPSLAIASNSLVCEGLFCTTSQTAVDILVEGSSQMVAERAASGSTPSVLAMDTDTTLLSSFTPGSAKTLDTATNYSAVVFSVVGA